MVQAEATKETPEDRNEDTIKGGLWQKLFGSYGPRRRRGLAAVGLNNAIDASEKAKVLSGEYCEEFANRQFRDLIKGGDPAHKAIFMALKALAERCTYEHPCDPSDVLDRDKLSIGAQKIKLIKKMIGLGEGAAVGAFFSLLPEKFFDQLMDVFEKNPSITKVIKVVFSSNERVASFKQELKSWLNAALMLAKQENYVLSPAVLGGMLFASPLFGYLSQVNGVDQQDSETTDCDVACAEVEKLAFMACNSLFPAGPDGNVGCANCALNEIGVYGFINCDGKGSFQLDGVLLLTLIITLAVTASGLINNGTVEETQFIGGSKVKVSRPYGLGDFIAGRQPTTKILNPTASILDGEVNYEKPAVVKETLTSYLLVALLTVVVMLAAGLILTKDR